MYQYNTIILYVYNQFAAFCQISAREVVIVIRISDGISDIEKSGGYLFTIYLLHS